MEWGTELQRLGYELLSCVTVESRGPKFTLSCTPDLPPKVNHAHGTGQLPDCSSFQTLVSNCMRNIYLAFFAVFSATVALGQNQQRVEGFDKVEFHHDANGAAPTRDFRGDARGYMTAAWWSPAQMKENFVSWKTGVTPQKQATTFVFIGASSVLPAQFSRGPSAKLTINNHDAVTFTIGCNRDFTWRQGEYELKYIAKRVEFPSFGSHRELRELHGNSGIYQLSVPADAVDAGKPALLKVELMPFEGWHNGWFMVKERKDVLKQSMESLEGEIEALRQDMARSSELMEILSTQLYSKMLGTDRFEHQVIYQNGFRHLHPADLVKLKNGELLLMAREGTEHISVDGDVILLRSSDGGKTWGGKQVIAGIKDLDEREGCGVQLSDGTIVVGIFYNNLYDADGIYKGKSKKATTKPGVRSLGTYVITSTDNGHTWSNPNFIDTKGMPFTNIEGPTDAPIEMPDGSILMAVIGYGINGDAKNIASVMLRSTDKSQTWKYHSTIASDPGGKLGGFVEPGIVRTKSGRIVAGLRNHGPDNAVYTTYSDDGGKNWAAIQKTAMYGHPVDLIQLADGRLMATYGIRPQHAIPGGVRACFSHDDGKSWDIHTEVQLRNDFLNWDVGYPESLELPDGRVLTVYYYNLFGRYFLGGTYWKP
jgi:sialidase-1